MLPPWKSFVLIIALTIVELIQMVLMCAKFHSASKQETLPMLRVVEESSVPVWSEWSDWSKCSVSCGSGHIRRYRSCVKNGTDILTQGCEKRSQYIDPNNVAYNQTKKCVTGIRCAGARNGGWSEWSRWSSCFPICISSDNQRVEQARNRQCNNPTPILGGDDCVGESSQLKNCTYATRCPIAGGFSDWFQAESCLPIHSDSNCTEGSVRIARTCTNPRPQFGGVECDGIMSDNMKCWYNLNCPVSIQPPFDFRMHVPHINVSMVTLNAVWRRTPYGEMAQSFRLNTEFPNRVFTITDVPVEVQRMDVYGEEYRGSVGLQLPKAFKIPLEQMRFSMTIHSISITGATSSSLTKSDYRLESVDGMWTSWSDWTFCNVRCYHERGEEKRTRTCLGKQLDGVACLGPDQLTRFCAGDAEC